MNRRTLLTTIAALVLLPAALQAEPKTYVIEMITEGGRKYFEPKYLEVAAGDTVRFVNVSGRHNTESIRGMIPDGVTPWRSALKETFDLTLTQEGVYGYKCSPHLSNGMIGLIVVGDPSSNLEAAKSVSLGRRNDAIFEELFTLVPNPS